MPAIKPNEVVPQTASRIPEYVIETFNELIRKKFTGHSAVFTLEEAKQAVAQAVVRHNPEILPPRIETARQYADENRYLDVEPIFVAAGWKVTFNKKEIGDKFDSHYVFSM